MGKAELRPFLDRYFLEPQAWCYLGLCLYVWAIWLCQELVTTGLCCCQPGLWSPIHFGCLAGMTRPVLKVWISPGFSGCPQTPIRRTALSKEKGLPMGEGWAHFISSRWLDSISFMKEWRPAMRFIKDAVYYETLEYSLPSPPRRLLLH